MPQNASGTPIAAAPYNLNDGFSPGQVITLKVPGLDTPAAFTNTDPIPLNDLSRNESQDSNEPIVVIDAETNKRVPIWVELDSNATSPATTALLIHPATQFESGHRYIVAMRKLKDAAGNKLAAPEGFRYYRDDLPSDEAAINDQRKRFDKIFRTLRKAQVKRHNLYLAWDFTVASDDNIAQRMLHIRDDAFAQLGDTNLSDGVVQGTAPSFTVDTVDRTEPGHRDRAAGHGHVHGPVLSDQQLRAAGGLRPRRERQPGPARHLLRPTSTASSRTPPSTIRARRRRGRRSTGTACSAAPTRSAAARSAPSPRRTTSSSAPPTRSASPRGTSPNTIGILQNLGKFPELTDRIQQGLLERAAASGG